MSQTPSGEITPESLKSVAIILFRVNTLNDLASSKGLIFRPKVLGHKRRFRARWIRIYVGYLGLAIFNKCLGKHVNTLQTAPARVSVLYTYLLYASSQTCQTRILTFLPYPSAHPIEWNYSQKVQGISTFERLNVHASLRPSLTGPSLTGPSCAILQVPDIFLNPPLIGFSEDCIGEGSYKTKASVAVKVLHQEAGGTTPGYVRIATIYSPTLTPLTLLQALFLRGSVMEGRARNWQIWVVGAQTIRCSDASNTPQQMMDGSWDRLLELLLGCWQTEPGDRPNADDIVSQLDNIFRYQKTK